MTIQAIHKPGKKKKSRSETRSLNSKLRVAFGYMRYASHISKDTPWNFGFAKVLHSFRKTEFGTDLRQQLENQAKLGQFHIHL